MWPGSWDWKQGAAVAEAQINTRNSLVYSLSVSPDGKFLAVGLSNPELRLLHCDDLRPVCTLKPPDPEEHFCAFCVRFTPDGKALAVGGGDMVFLIDISTGKRTAVFRGHRFAVKSLDFSDDGKLLASGADEGGDAEVYLWDLQKAVPAGGTGRNVGPVTGVYFAPDGKSVVTGALSGGGVLERLDIKTLMKK
jgi:WD40 repeat protein